MARGWKQDVVWAEMFHLRPEDHRLLDAPGPSRSTERSSKAPTTTTSASTWRNYLRGLLRRGWWYSFASRPSIIFYVCENKTVASREARGDGDAVGRQLSLVFFERFGGVGNLVRRVNREAKNMTPILMTVAELMTTSGHLLPLKPERPTAETELLLEAAWAQQDLRRFTGILETQAEDIHVYTLVDEVSAEDAFAAEKPFENLSKMALTRILESPQLSRAGGELENPGVLSRQPPAAAGRRGRGRGRSRAAQKQLDRGVCPCEHKDGYAQVPARMGDMIGVVAYMHVW